MKITRWAREGAFTFVDVLLLLGIIIALQYIIYRHPHEWDLTGNKTYSLSDLSKKVLSSIKGRVDLWVFVDKHDQQTKDLVHEYEVTSSSIVAHFIDPNSEPAKAREFGVGTPPPLIVAVYGKDREQVSQPDENRVTNAINQLLSGKRRVVYFIQGHGEPDPESGSPAGYSSFKEALQGENFTVKSLTLFREKEMPQDASAIVIIEPRYSFFPKEKEWLTGYMLEGGRMLFLCGMGASKDGLDFLKAFGVKVGSDLVADPTMNLVGFGPEFLAANNYGSGPIAQPFAQARTPTPVIFPLTRSISGALPAPKGIAVDPLVSTSPAGKAFPVRVEGKKALINFKNPAQTGAISIACTATIAGKDRSKTGRLVVTGSSFLANNQWLNISANRDFSLNILSWLTESQNTIAIHPKQSENQPLLLDSKSLARLSILCLLALPGFGVVLGISNWLRRKNL